MQHTSVDLARVTGLHRALIAQQDDHRHQRTDQTAPPLVRKDVREHRTAFPQPRTIRRDRRRHGIVAAHADSEYDSPDSEPDDRARGTEVAGRVRDGHDRRKDDEHQLLAVYGAGGQKYALSRV